MLLTIVNDETEFLQIVSIIYRHWPFATILSLTFEFAIVSTCVLIAYLYYRLRRRYRRDCYRDSSYWQQQQQHDNNYNKPNNCQNSLSVTTSSDDNTYHSLSLSQQQQQQQQQHQQSRDIYENDVNGKSNELKSPSTVVSTLSSSSDYEIPITIKKVSDNLNTSSSPSSSSSGSNDSNNDSYASSNHSDTKYHQTYDYPRDSSFAQLHTLLRSAQTYNEYENSR